MSIHDKLNKIRKPRVHITYNVETEGSQVEKELPFVVGVLGDFSGQSTEIQKPLKDRKFIKIDGDNLDTTMKSLKPGLQLRIKNTLSKEDTEMMVSLKFNNMADFEPEQLIQQVPALKSLMDARNKLRDLLSKTDRSESLEQLLEETLNQPEKLALLARELEEYVTVSA